MTVNRDLKARVATSTPESVTGLDGKSYPASRPEPKRAGRQKGSAFLSPDKPVDLTIGRHREIAERVKRTLMTEGRQDAAAPQPWPPA